MNSKNTTFPLNWDKEIFSPVKPFGPTTGNVKSGAPDAPVVVIGVFVVVVLDGSEGWAKEYMAQIATTRITNPTIFSPRLNPFLRCLLLAFD